MGWTVSYVAPSRKFRGAVEHSKGHQGDPVPVTTKLRKRLGSEAVQDLIREATERARVLPKRSVRDPWPSNRLTGDDPVPEGAA